MPPLYHINPAFFTDAELISVSPLARLLLIALWFEADKDGCLYWCVKKLKRHYLPADDCDIQSLGNELANHDLIQFCNVADETYVLIANVEDNRILTRCDRS